MKIKKIAVISGTIAQYDLIDLFAKLLVDGFREIISQDCECELIEYSKDTEDDRVLERISTEYDLIVTFNGTYVNFSNAPLKYHLIKNNCLCLTFLIDHPYAHAERLLNPVKRQIVSCIDKRHVSYINRFYDGLKNTVFIPHGTILPNVSLKKWEEKEGDIAFFGSYVPPQQSLHGLEESAPETQEIFFQIVEEIWNNRFNTLEDSMEYVLRKYNIYESEAQLAELIASSVFLDMYIRNERRALLINTLINAGIDVSVYGNGWDKLEASSKEHLIINNSVSLQDCANEMTRYRIVINNMPLFANGSHERIFMIPSAGSILVTDSNPYIDEIYEEGRDYFRYSWERIDELPQLITTILSQKEKAVDMIERSRQKVLENHLWRNRAQEILDYIETI